MYNKFSSLFFSKSRAELNQDNVQQKYEKDKAPSFDKSGPCIISVANQKGGCGKTTTAVNLGACLARKGFSVLLVDLDPQSHSSLGIGVDVDELETSIYDVIVKNVDFEKIIVKTYIDNLDLAPANPVLSGAQLEIADLIGREGILRTALYKAINTGSVKHDYIIMDCSPSLNLINVNGFVASRFVLIPMQTHYFSIEGMKELFPIVGVVKDRLNPQLEILGILPTLVDSENTMSQDILHQIHEYFQGHVFSTMIRLNARLAEASNHRMSIFDYDPDSYGASDYARLTDEIAGLTQKEIDSERRQ